MTTSVCPNCRASIPLDTAVCPECGAAVRPTCAHCGEALAVGDERCPACGEPVGGAAPEPSTSTAPVTPVVSVTPAQTEAEPERRSRVRLPPYRHLVAIGLVSGLVVAAGLLALELVRPSSGLHSVSLESATFEELGFAVGYPAGWTVQPGRHQRRDAVTFLDPSRSDRGFRVLVDDLSLEQARERTEARSGDRGYELIGIDPSAEIGEVNALEHIYNEDGLHHEQWYVERPGGTFRIDFWAPAGRAEEASALNAQIVDSFEIR